jgi:hypothetical protein
MTNIVIKGMEKPENCSKCKLAQHLVFANSIVCPIIEQTVGYYDEGFHSKIHNCPVTFLPEKYKKLDDYEKLARELREAAEKSACGECGMNLRNGTTKKGALFAKAADAIEELKEKFADKLEWINDGN